MKANIKLKKYLKEINQTEHIKTELDVFHPFLF